MWDLSVRLSVHLFLHLFSCCLCKWQFCWSWIAAATKGVPCDSTPVKPLPPWNLWLWWPGLTRGIHKCTTLVLAPFIFPFYTYVTRIIDIFLCLYHLVLLLTTAVSVRLCDLRSQYCHQPCNSGRSRLSSNLLLRESSLHQHCHPYAQYDQIERAAVPKLSRWGLAVELSATCQCWQWTVTPWCMTTVVGIIGQEHQSDVRPFDDRTALWGIQEIQSSFTDVELRNLRK